MITIVLFCSTGLSTNLLIRKMEVAAEKKELEVNVKSYPESVMKNHIHGADVVLVGPQIRHAIDEIKEECDQYHVPIEVISTRDYGMMDGEKILAQALRLYSLQNHHNAQDEANN